MTGQARSRGLVAIAVAVAIASPACKSRRKASSRATEYDAGRPAEPAPPDHEHERVILAHLRMHVVPPLQPHEVDRSTLEKQLAEQLGGSGHFFSTLSTLPPGTTGRPATLRVEINYEAIPEGDEVSLLAAVELEVDWEGPNDLAPTARVMAEHPIPKPARDADIDRALADHVSATLAEAALELIEEETLRTGPAEEIVAALASDSVDTQLWALALVRERKLAQAYDAVIELLDSPERDVRDTAVGALMAIGDPRAVTVMANKVELSDYEFLKVVIEAASVLGGEEAVSFLEFVASGHPDQEIRDRATKALERLSRRDQPDPAGAP